MHRCPSGGIALGVNDVGIDVVSSVIARGVNVVVATDVVLEVDVGTVVDYHGADDEDIPDVDDVVVFDAVVTTSVAADAFAGADDATCYFCCCL